MNKSLLFWGFIFWGISPFMLFGQSTDIFDYKHSLKYANHLFELRKYESAAKEFERVLFFAPTDSSIQHKLLLSYFLTKKFEVIAERTPLFYPELAQTPASIGFTYSKALFFLSEEDELTHFVATSNYLRPKDRKLLEMAKELKLKNWGAAQKIYEQALPQDQRLDLFSPLISKTKTIKRKSPLLALGLSIPFPGLGRVYTKQWKDGIISFAIIGSLSYAAFRNFSNNGRGSVLGWIYGSLAGGFYLGNLYGSFQSAKRYNDKSYHEISDEALRLLYMLN